MRNQQIKKVNRIFFSGQHDEKRKWLEQMAAEGWHLLSETSFVYSFQRVASDLAENQHAYKSILGSDFQKSMPLFQESRHDWVALLTEGKTIHNNLTLSTSRMDKTKIDSLTKKRRLVAGALALVMLLIVLMTKIAIISTGDYLPLFRLQFFAGILFVGTCLIFGIIMLFKGFMKVFAPVCKTKE